MNVNDAQKELLEVSARIKKYQELSGIASYDLLTNSPKGAAARRNELRAFLRDLTREMILSPRTEELVAFLEEKNIKEQLSDAMKAEVDEYRERINDNNATPIELSRELSSLCTDTERLWIQVRHTGPYTELKRKIGCIIDIMKQISDARMEYMKLPQPAHPLDPIIDNTDKGMTAARLSLLFEEIRETTLPLLDKIKAKQATTTERLTFAMDPEDQKKICLRMLNDIGYFNQFGIMGTGEHPCTYDISPTNVRFTNHIYPDNFFRAFGSAAHEGGHGIYAMNIAPEYSDMLIGHAIPGSIHETSSRFWEIIVGHSLEFWQYAVPMINETCPGVLGNLTPEECWRNVNLVNLSPIRLQSDELSYNLHIMMRFEIEKMLFEGILDVMDIEEAWNKMSFEWLGLIPDCPANGWAQDMHWPAGLFGYFQSYTMGNLNSCQLAATMKKDIPDMYSQIAEGNFTPIREWLTNKWYRHGKVYSGERIMEMASGDTLNARYLCEFLKDKYSKIYNL